MGEENHKRNIFFKQLQNPKVHMVTNPSTLTKRKKEKKEKKGKRKNNNKTTKISKLL